MLQLRPYQTEAIRSALKDLKTCNSVGIIAPTGAGKTIIMKEIAERFIRKDKERCNVIIVSHLSVLQGQTLDNFIKMCEYRTDKYQGQIKPSPLTRVVISTMQTLRRPTTGEFLHRRLLANKTKLIMIDEAQLYGSKSYDLIEELFPEAKIIGLSASPFRGNKFSFNQFDKVSYSISLQELIDKKFLVPPVLHQICHKDMDIPERIAHVAGVYAAKLEGKGALVYWNTKVAAENASMAFNEAGIPSAFIHDGVKAIRKREVLERFDERKIKVIHNVNILSAGYDSPKVFGIFMPMGTNSPVMYIQRIGRGLRLYRNKKSCQVFIYGDEPAIKRGLFARMNRVALRVKEDPIDDRSDIYNEYDWLMSMEEPNVTKLRYTVEVMKAHKIIEDKGLPHLAKLIRHKKFPKKYLRSLMSGEAVLDEQAKGEATDRQRQILIAKGFDAGHIDELDRRDAGGLISMIQSRLNSQWIVKVGLHENKHISEVHGAYFGAIKRKNPRHPVLRMYSQWIRAGRPQENEERT